MADVVCAGILVADIFGSPVDAAPAQGQLVSLDGYLLSAGGCACNTAADLKRLGLEPTVLGKVGDDLFGGFVLQDLRRLGIDTNYVTKSQTKPTSCTFILNVRGEDRRYIHCFGANADFSIGDIDLKCLDGAKVLYMGGYLAMPAFRPSRLAELFQEARRRGVITALDVVIPAGASSPLAQVQPALPYTDVFLPNDDEARALTGRSDPLEQAEALAEINPDCTIVITQGRRGALAKQGRSVVRAGVFRVDAIDESGSGDAFDAGFLAAMLEGKSLNDSLRFASAVGASCTRALGCHAGVFNRKEALEFLAHNQLEVTSVSIY